jgi:hypothetical protein
MSLNLNTYMKLMSALRYNKCLKISGIILNAGARLRRVPYRTIQSQPVVGVITALLQSMM